MKRLLIILFLCSSCVVNNQHRITQYNKQYGGKNYHHEKYKQKKGFQLWATIVVPLIIGVNIR